jgi:hypothetical protein
MEILQVNFLYKHTREIPSNLKRVGSLVNKKIPAEWFKDHGSARLSHDSPLHAVKMKIFGEGQTYSRTIGPNHLRLASWDDCKASSSRHIIEAEGFCKCSLGSDRCVQQG